MIMARFAAAALAFGFAAPTLLGLVEPAAAQSEFGDTRLSYSGGIVTDDDLVPGRAPNQPYLVDEEAGAGVYDDTDPSGYDGPALRSRTNSPNLIGPDGRTVRY